MAQLVPPPRPAEGPEHNVIVDGVGTVVAQAPDSAEEAESPAPVALPLEEDGHFLGGELGEEGVEAFLVGASIEGIRLEKPDGGTEGAGGAVGRYRLDENKVAVGKGGGERGEEKRRRVAR